LALGKQIHISAYVIDALVVGIHGVGELLDLQILLARDEGMREKREDATGRSHETGSLILATIHWAPHSSELAAREGEGGIALGMRAF